MNLCCAKEPVDVTLDPDGRLLVKPHLLQCSQRFSTQFSTHFLQTGCLSAACVGTESSGQRPDKQPDTHGEAAH